MKRIFTSLLLIFSAMIALNAQVYFSNNFDGSSPAPGWAVFDNGIGLQRSWTIYSVGYSAPNAAAIQYENVSSGIAEDYLATPLIDLSSATNPRLSFMAAQSYGTDYGSEYYVLVSTTEQSSIQAYTEIANWDETALGVDGYSYKTVDLSAYAGQQIYIAFMMANDDGDDFIIDDVVVDEGLENNLSLMSLNLTNYILSGQGYDLSANVRNSGTNTINSIIFEWTDGTNTYSEPLTVNIGAGESADITHPTQINFSEVGEYNITATVTQVNGGDDAYPADNSASTVTNLISQDGGKKVLFEEGTGTWCGWCPRGAVAMEYMTETYPDSFIGIAVHNNDPMTLEEYDDNAGIQGFPGMNVMRMQLGVGVSQEDMISLLQQHLASPSPASVSATSTLSGRDLTIDVSSTFYSNFSNQNSKYRLGVVLVEDDVTGTASGYAQVNYYSGGSAGDMGGYEDLPNPVPANQMVYDHVGRALIGGYDGLQNSLPESITDGQTASHTFNYTIPNEFDLEHLHGVALLINTEDGSIVNANSFPIGNMSASNVALNKGFSIYPNPANDLINISMTDNANYQAFIYNTAGKQVASFDINNQKEFTLPVYKLPAGVYILTISNGNESFSKKLIIK